MATTRRQNPPTASPTSAVKAYSIPVILLAASIFFQLVVLPRHFPVSHYEVLRIPKSSSIEQVSDAYDKFVSKWSDQEPPLDEFVKVRYAFEVLTDEILKRDYDIYNIDEQSHVIEKVKVLGSGKNISEIDLPLVKTITSDPANQVSNFINPENFLSMFEDDKALLIQIISTGSNRSAHFSANWNRIVNLLDGVANTGTVELGDVQLAVYLAEKKSNGQPFFRNGLPALLAFPPGCKSSRCLSRYDGELSVDAVTDWLATNILSLPRILYYSKESLVPNFLVKSKPHQVKVIFVSKTGERASPIIRQAAKNYWSYATFAFALWKEEESAYWWNMFGVESAPAIVILKDPGVEPLIYQGAINSSLFTDIMEKNKLHVLPQLRNVTASELGCDVNGYSRAGSDTKIWYCAIVAGRPSQELSKMRGTMRRIQEQLSSVEESEVVDQEPTSVPAALALKQKRLTFAWMDGEAQNKYCFFHIHSEHSYETCGPRRGVVDAPQLFLVRYERKDGIEQPETRKQPTNIFQSNDEPDPVSTLVAKYNGSSEIPEIMKWIAQTIKDGDSRELPPFRTKTPELIPEDANQSWSQGAKRIISRENVKQLTSGFISRPLDHVGDPRIGPALLLAALMSFGFIWLQRSRLPESTNRNESEPKDEDRPKRRSRPRSSSNQLIPPSITDMEPIDAQQMTFSDSDSP